MYCINYRFWTQKKYILFKISASHLFLNRSYFWLGPGSTSGKKEKKRSAWAWQKAERYSLGRGNVSLEKTVCMQRSTHTEVPRGRNAWRTSRTSAGKEGKGGGRPSPSPGHRSARFALRYFSFLTKFFPHLEAWSQAFLFSGLQTIENFRFWDGEDYKYEIFSEYRSRVNQRHFGGKTC